ncbi:MAG: major outer membrane protein [Ignavibacteria bacterium]|nr:major outer membrane protein [Ignavibacteria bacterium]
MLENKSDLRVQKNRNIRIIPYISNIDGKNRYLLSDAEILFKPLEKKKTIIVRSGKKFLMGDADFLFRDNLGKARQTRTVAHVNNSDKIEKSTEAVKVTSQYKKVANGFSAFATLSGPLKDTITKSSMVKVLKALAIIFLISIASCNLSGQNVMANNSGSSSFDSRFAPYYEATDGKLFWTSPVPRERNKYITYSAEASSDNLLKLNSQPEKVEISGFGKQIQSIGSIKASSDGMKIVGAATTIEPAGDSTWMIFIAERQQKDYTFKKMIYSGKSWASHPCFGSKDTVVYFSLLEDTKTNADIVFSKSNRLGDWSAPSKLTTRINTPYNEISPYYYEGNNEKILYFASDRTLGSGGFDLYESSFDTEDKEWSYPKPMSSLNSASDDAFPAIAFNEKGGSSVLFASTRDNGNDWKLYQGKINIEKEKPKTLVLKVIVFKCVGVRKTEPYQMANVRVRQVESFRNLANQTTDVRGETFFRLNNEGQFFIEASAIGKAVDSKQITITKQDLIIGSPITVELCLEKDETMIRDTVLFAFGKSDLHLSNDFYLTTNRINEYLKDNPDNRIIIEGHTDKIGSDEYNMKLSQDRAEAVRNQILSKYGISPLLIKAEGRGKSKPLVDCTNRYDCSPNRRVQIIYTSRNYQNWNK